MRHPCLPALLAVVLGCAGERPAPAHSQFLVAAGDSTYWVQTGGRRPRVRGSPIQLGRYAGRFFELYVVDDDRSYFDALLVGQRIYRRDIVTGDSMLVFEDTTVAALERWYLRQNPDDRRLAPDEDGSQDPHLTAVAHVDILDHHGPYLSFAYHADGDVAGGDEWHEARHGVVDLRTGRQVTVGDLFGELVARRVVAEGARLFTQAVDSVIASGDSRAREAMRAIADFDFDAASFVLLDDDRAPAVRFSAPGHGARAGGISLELSPIPVAPPTWWAAVRGTLPQADSAAAARWARDGYDIVARYEGDSTRLRLAVVDTARHAWPVARIPAPARRLYWLDRGEADSLTLKALARAFDDAALYSEEARAVRGPRPRRDQRARLASGLYRQPRAARGPRAAT